MSNYIHHIHLQYLPGDFEWPEHLFIDIFDLWIKPPGSQLQGNNRHLDNVHDEESKVPAKDIRGTHDHIGPDGQ